MYTCSHIYRYTCNKMATYIRAVGRKSLMNADKECQITIKGNTKELNYKTNVHNCLCIAQRDKLQSNMEKK